MQKSSKPGGRRIDAGARSASRAKVDEAVRLLQACTGRDASFEELQSALRVLRKLPSGVPSEVVVSAWRWVVTFPLVHHTLRTIPDDRAADVFEALSRWKSPASTFLLTATAADRSAGALQAANRAFYAVANDPAPWAPSGRARILAAIRQPETFSAARAALADHWAHPALAPAPDGDAGDSGGSPCFRAIEREECPCGGWNGDALPFFRALLYDGGSDAVETLRPIFRAAEGEADAREKLAKYHRFAATQEVKAMFVDAAAVEPAGG